MKKLALIFIVSVLCISPFTASAGSNGWKNFQGTYEMIASGSCIHSVAGWEDSNDPPNYDLDVVTPPFSPKDPTQVCSVPEGGLDHFKGAIFQLHLHFVQLIVATFSNPFECLNQYECIVPSVF